MKILILIILFMTCSVSCGKAEAENFNFVVMTIDGTRCITNGVGIACDF